MLRHIRDFFDINFKIEDFVPRNEGDDSLRLGSKEKVQLTCVGAGFTNLSKTVL